MTTQDPQQPKSSGSIGDLVAKITSQFSALVRDEIRLAGMQAKAKAISLGIGGVMLAIAGVLSLYALGFLLASAAWGLSNFMPTWLAFLAVAGGLLAICALLGLVGAIALLKARKGNIDPKIGMEKNIDALKKGLEK
ncbi:MAG: phage holin family protein [Actinomycetaceae bacterium]|nr:phage holin family protein [Actinomycetaceae bacterium]